MSIPLIIIIFIILLLTWSITLVFYHDRDVTPIETDESKCFAPRCHSIIRIHEDEKADTAILMIHGFPSTPHVYEYSSKKMYDSGIDTYAYLMPGFGTSPDDFVKTNFTQWFDFECRRYEELKKKYKNVFVLGTSMGGLMTLKFGEKYSGTEMEPNAIITISAPIVFNSIKDRIISNKYWAFTRILNIFVKSIGANTVNGIDSEDGNEDWTGYHGLFFNQSMSLIKAEKIVRKEFNKLTCPLLSIHDTGDKTVPFKNFGIIAKENGSKDYEGRVTRMKNYSHSHHVLLLYRSSRVKLTEEIIKYMKGKIKNA
jgi:carboxylesterase